MWYRNALEVVPAHAKKANIGCAQAGVRLGAEQLKATAELFLQRIRGGLAILLPPRYGLSDFALSVVRDLKAEPLHLREVATDELVSIDDVALLGILHGPQELGLVLGVGFEGLIVVLHQGAQQLLGDSPPLLGDRATAVPMNRPRRQWRLRGG
jgi:hypothetical protein